MISKAEQRSTLIHALQSSFEKAAHIDQLRNFLIIHRISRDQFQNLIKQIARTYTMQYQNVKAYIVLLIISLLNEFSKSLQLSLQFLEGLILGRIALVSANAGQLTFVQTLKYLKALVHVLIPLILQKQKQQLLFNFFLKTNSGRIRDNDFIAVLIQILLIIEVKENVQSQNISQFFYVLSQTMDQNNSTKKLIYQTLQKFLKQQHEETGLNFQKLVILRDSDQSCQNFKLNYKNSVLHKYSSKQEMEQWIVKAYRGQFQKIRLSSFREGNILELFDFCMKLQVFGSSPMISDLEDHIKSGQFLQMFVKFLMGNKLIEQQYSFGCDNWRSALTFLWQQSGQMNTNTKQNLLNETRLIFGQQSCSQ